jgi:anti-sigma regulatory factor (Ser/Thr protein kinase)
MPTTPDPPGQPLEEPSTPGWQRVRITGLPVGLMLRVDEYVTTLSQELGMIRLDRRPETVGPARMLSIEVVDELLIAFAEPRNVVRVAAETAFDEGRDTFDVDVALPPEAAPAAYAMIDALREVQALSAERQILLPPLDAEAAELFFEFLSECARQVEQGAARPEPVGRLPGTARRPAELEGRRVERMADAPMLRHEERRAARRFTRDLDSATVARRFVVDTLRAWGLDELAARSELPVAELVSNALLHSADVIEVEVKSDGDCVLVEVHDTTSTPPEVRRRGNEADSGRGLLLVDALVDRWGYDDHSVLAKRVWFELSHR